MEIKVGIVVLNYMNYIDTIECIESIAILDYKNIEIVVVENGSSNESFEKIYNHCKRKRNVRIIKVKRNLGFARGCNVGIDYALRRKCEHVLVVNNDTIFIDKDMIVKLLKVAEDQKIGLIGPGIIGANPKDQENPCRGATTFRMIFRDLKNEISRFISTLLRRLGLKKFLKRFIKINRNKLIECVDRGHTESLETIISNNLILNGAATLFTKNYFKHFTCGFYPGTFLYYEENILNVIARKKGIWMACVPQANIYHKGSKSALLSYANNPWIKRTYRIMSILTCLYVKIMPLILLGIERRPDIPPRKWTQRRVGDNIDASS